MNDGSNYSIIRSRMERRSTHPINVRVFRVHLAMSHEFPRKSRPRCIRPAAEFLRSLYRDPVIDMDFICEEA
jgi:hypothetical protein